eukprot:3399703-Pyramimonas_sp.AAC.1
MPAAPVQAAARALMSRMIALRICSVASSVGIVAAVRFASLSWVWGVLSNARPGARCPARGAPPLRGRGSRSFLWGISFSQESIMAPRPFKSWLVCESFASLLQCEAPSGPVDANVAPGSRTVHESRAAIDGVGGDQFCLPLQ